MAISTIFEHLMESKSQFICVNTINHSKETTGTHKVENKIYVFFKINLRYTIYFKPY